MCSLQHFLVPRPSFRYGFEPTPCNIWENNVEMRFVTAQMHKQVHIACFGGFPLFYCILASCSGDTYQTRLQFFAIIYQAAQAVCIR